MVPEKSPPSSSSRALSLSSTSSSPSNANVNDEMRIAWRYNNLDRVDSEQGGTNQMDAKNSYTFDLSQSIADDALASSDITLFGMDECARLDGSSIFHNPAYVSLIQKLRDKMNDSTFGVSAQTSSAPPMPKKNLLRICIESLGSPLWYDEHFVRDFCLFLSVLKAAVRDSLSVCCITAPTYLFKCIVSATCFFFLQLSSFSKTFPKKAAAAATVFHLEFSIFRFVFSLACSRIQRYCIVYEIWSIMPLNWSHLPALIRKRMPCLKSIMDCFSFAKWQH